MNRRLERLLERAKIESEESSVSSAQRIFANEKAARGAFLALQERFWRVAEWNDCSGISQFALFDEKGGACQSGIFSENLFVRVYLKGSGKYDWVKVVETAESEREAFLKVRPTFDPTDQSAEKAAVSHFFAGETSNNFCLTREENQIDFYVVGLNEKQNTAETKNALETVRNVLTANVGSFLGIQKAEWETFCRNFLDSASSKS